MNRNYQKELDALISKNRIEARRQTIMLHACCACCASYVLEYLSDDFDIYLLYYNPNITEPDEYNYRHSELVRLVDEMGLSDRVRLIDADYDTQQYLDNISGLESATEGGSRCKVCFDMRLGYTAKKALEYNCDYFATTLTISPLKNATLINDIGERIQQSTGANYLATDFKKKNGYKRSIELSRQYELYRQNYCGCVFSKKTEE